MKRAQVQGHTIGCLIRLHRGGVLALDIDKVGGVQEVHWGVPADHWFRGITSFLARGIQTSIVASSPFAQRIRGLRGLGSTKIRKPSSLGLGLSLLRRRMKRSMAYLGGRLMRVQAALAQEGSRSGLAWKLLPGVGSAPGTGLVTSSSTRGSSAPGAWHR
jgi:hypothetical protein